MAKYFKAFCEKHDLTFYFAAAAALALFVPAALFPGMTTLTYSCHAKATNACVSFGPSTPIRAISSSNLMKRSSITTSSSLFAMRRPRLSSPISAISTYVMALCLTCFLLMAVPVFARQKRALIYSLFRAQFVPEKHGGVVAMGSRILLGLVRSPRARYKLWKRAERNMYPISGMQQNH